MSTGDLLTMLNDRPFPSWFCLPFMFLLPKSRHLDWWWNSSLSKTFAHERWGCCFVNGRWFSSYRGRHISRRRWLDCTLSLFPRQIFSIHTENKSSPSFFLNGTKKKQKTDGKQRELIVVVYSISSLEFVFLFSFSYAWACNLRPYAETRSVSQRSAHNLESRHSQQCLPLGLNSALVRVEFPSPTFFL